MCSATAYGKKTTKHKKGTWHTLSSREETWASLPFLILERAVNMASLHSERQAKPHVWLVSNKPNE
jgi:hypothetical protein